MRLGELFGFHKKEGGGSSADRPKVKNATKPYSEPTRELDAKYQKELGETRDYINQEIMKVENKFQKEIVGLDDPEKIAELRAEKNKDQEVLRDSLAKLTMNIWENYAEEKRKGGGKN